MKKIIDVATSVAHACFDRFVLAHAYGSEELWNIDRDELLHDVTQYMKHEIKEGKYWIPYALEYRFGMPSRGDDEDIRSTESQSNSLFWENISLFEERSIESIFRLIKSKCESLIIKRAPLSM
ncbi:MAG: hypothetical protein R2877_03795 [Bdellovibrionota bacterium]